MRLLVVNVAVRICGVMLCESQGAPSGFVKEPKMWWWSIALWCSFAVSAAETL